MDIDMPVMNGLDAIRLLRSGSATAGLPIIAVTAMAGVANEQACLSAGADGFLAKPYPLRDLMAMMQTVGRIQAARSPDGRQSSSV
jgi:CheY-like chemotaxis protein